MHPSSIRLLIAEDDYLVGQMIVGMAESVGYSIIGMASTGTEAVALTASLRPDVVLMDIQMPDMDGIAATEQISATCPTPVVVLTAFETRDLVAQTSDAGAAAYLLKPPQPHELERAITIALARFADLMEQRRLKAEAEAALQARDELLGLISHDLKNPLTAIQGYIYLLQDALNQGDPEIGQYVGSILPLLNSATKRVSSQVNELIDIAHLRAGKQIRLRREPTDLVGLLGGLLNEYQQTTDVHQLTLVTHLPALVANVDELRLGRAISNLLSNAIKYSPRGGAVTLTLEHEQTGQLAWAVLTLSDQGNGIPAADLPTIFEPFQRASNVAPDISGTGLGLASVRQVVAQHGGTITVASSEGCSSTFTLRLPVGAIK